MGSRERKSAAQLTVAGGVQAMRRPAAPNELTDERAAEWRAVVGRMPADWFARETYPLLVQYCRHVVAARRIHQLIEALQADAELDFTGDENAHLPAGHL